MLSTLVRQTVGNPGATNSTVSSASALDAFFLEHELQGYTADQVLDNYPEGQRLLVDAEDVKKELGANKQSTLTRSALLAKKTLMFPITVDQFNEWIRPDVESAELRWIVSCERPGSRWKTCPDYTSPEVLATFH